MTLQGTRDISSSITMSDIIWVIKSRKNEMGGACGTYREEKTCIQGFGGVT
jgi:hypothetical protein